MKIFNKALSRTLLIWMMIHSYFLQASEMTSELNSEEKASVSLASKNNTVEAIIPSTLFAASVLESSVLAFNWCAKAKRLRFSSHPLAWIGFSVRSLLVVGAFFRSSIYLREQAFQSGRLFSEHTCGAHSVPHLNRINWVFALSGIGSSVKAWLLHEGSIGARQWLFMGGTVLFGLKDLVLMQFVLPSFASTQG